MYPQARHLRLEFTGILCAALALAVCGPESFAHAVDYYNGWISCPTDLVPDRETGFADLIEMISDWGPCEGCPGDIDDSGSIDFGDLLYLLANWGECD